MNERIRELKYQAEKLAWLEHKANCIKNGRDPSMPHANALNMTFEKFAKLIVQECANTAYQSLYEDRVFDDSPNNIRCNVMDAIKKHFGVE